MQKSRSFLHTVFLFALASALTVASISPVHAASPSADGNVQALEWYGIAVSTLIDPADESYCGITFTHIRHLLDQQNQCVTFALTGQAPGIAEGTQLGFLLKLAGREIAAYRQGEGASYETAQYYAEGGIFIAGSVEGDYSLELMLGCKTAQALDALDSLVIQLLDPAGDPSKEFPYPITPPEPETTTVKTTTTKVTTTKTTTSPKAPTLQTGSSTKSSAAQTTGAKSTTGARSSAVPTLPATLPAALPAAQLTPDTTSTTQQKNSGQSSAAKTQSTVVRRQPAALPTPESTIPHGTLWTYPTYFVTEALAENLPEAAEVGIEAQTAQSAPRSPALFAVAGLLTALSGVLVFAWLRTNGWLKFLAHKKRE
ncbi:MAG: hypothetical protein LBQ33_03705 [Oscillospiraceae bacterium]|nr:hypothetical protein [Oscillospiraceae bacterium]